MKLIIRLLFSACVAYSTTEAVLSTLELSSVPYLPFIKLALFIPIYGITKSVLTWAFSDYVEISMSFEEEPTEEQIDALMKKIRERQ